MNRDEIIGMAGMIVSANGMIVGAPHPLFCTVMFFLFLGLSFIGRENK